MINGEFLYFKTVTTILRIIFHWCNSGFVSWIPSIHWFQNVPSYQLRLTLGFSFQTFLIISWWNDTDFFKTWDTFILEFITIIQFPGSESMHRLYINVDPEGGYMCYCNIGLIKVNAFDIMVPVGTVACKKSMHQNRHLTWYQ